MRLGTDVGADAAEAALWSRRGLFAGLTALCGFPALAAKRPVSATVESRDGVLIATRDLSPRFLAFYAAAKSADPDRRFALWKDLYDFAAVPPTPEGDKIARRLLDAAWLRYPAALASIQAGAPAMRPLPLEVAIRVADALEAPRPLKVGIIAYVGGFETNAFTNATPEGPVVALPLEMDVPTRTLILPHEMTHAVHIIVGRLSPGYQRTLGRVVFEEGLAMRTTQRLEPGRPDFAYVGEKGWFDEAMNRRGLIFAALAPQLAATDPQTLFRFTMGQGAAGLEREAYIAGWLVVGQLLAQGANLPTLARTPEGDMPDLVHQALQALIHAEKF